MNKYYYLGFAIVFIFIISGFSSMYHVQMDHDHMAMDDKIELRNVIQQDMRSEHMNMGNYRCCIDEPCSYCLKKEEGCDCLEDIMLGKHPCGECIGEIMEGHGNKFLAPYFATAIAEKVGVDHLESIKLIIADMYGISVEEQV